MARRNGVDIVIEKVGGEVTEAIKKIADFLSISPTAVFKFRRQGWFPLDRAKRISTEYDIPLADLVRDDVREALLNNNA